MIPDEWTESDYMCTEWDMSSEDIVTLRCRTTAAPTSSIVKLPSRIGRRCDLSGFRYRTPFHPTPRLCAHLPTGTSFSLCSMDSLESPARAMFEASDGEHPASPQYLLPMEYTHSDGAAEVHAANLLVIYQGTRHPAKPSCMYIYIASLWKAAGACPSIADVAARPCLRSLYCQPDDTTGWGDHREYCEPLSMSNLLQKPVAAAEISAGTHSDILVMLSCRKY